MNDFKLKTILSQVSNVEILESFILENGTKRGREQFLIFFKYKNLVFSSNIILTHVSLSNLSMTTEHKIKLLQSKLDILTNLADEFYFSDLVLDLNSSNNQVPFDKITMFIVNQLINIEILLNKHAPYSVYMHKVRKEVFKQARITSCTSEIISNTLKSFNHELSSLDALLK